MEHKLATSTAYLVPKGCVYTEIERDMTGHYCEIPEEKQTLKPTKDYGGAIGDCYELKDGTLYAQNDEYGSRVLFCPICGYKAKINPWGK